MIDKIEQKSFMNSEVAWLISFYGLTARVDYQPMLNKNAVSFRKNKPDEANREYTVLLGTEEELTKEIVEEAYLQVFVGPDEDEKVEWSEEDKALYEALTTG